jgi:hypothetical protein
MHNGGYDERGSVTSIVLDDPREKLHMQQAGAWCEQDFDPDQPIPMEQARVLFGALHAMYQQGDLSWRERRQKDPEARHGYRNERRFIRDMLIDGGEIRPGPYDCLHRTLQVLASVGMRTAN